MIPDKQQQAVIDSNEPNAVVLAGPGSGKTQTMVNRIIRLIRDGAEPNRIAAVTYTVSAAKEIADRLCLIQLGYIGTLHGFCVRLLRENPVEGIPSQFGILTQDDADDLFDEVCAEQSCRGQAMRDAKTLARKAIGAPGLDGPPWQTQAERVLGCYYRRMREIGLLSFDAILHYAIRLTGQVRVKQWDHVFVDEAQDMAEADTLIYSALPCARWFFADPDQAVFGFRGADPQHLRTFAMAMPVLRLENNYRSGPEICATAERLIAHNSTPFGPKRLISYCNVMGEIRIVDCLSPAAESRFIAHRLPLWEHCRETRSAAVLTRTNRQADWLSEKLTEFGVAVARRCPPPRPMDWHWATMLVGLAQQPSESGLARYVGKRFGAKGIKRVADAWNSGQRITAGMVPTALRDLPAVLEMQKISLESRLLVEQSIRDLPEDADSATLLADLDRRAYETSIAGDGVYVGTVHSAKGREWDMVFVPGMEEGMWPHRLSADDVEEERRLLYVAITRARESVTLTWSNTEKTEPSRFLGELAQKSACASAPASVG